MAEDTELERIARQEAARRVERILGAIRRDAARPRWEEVYRQAHSLAGLGAGIDPELTKSARRLVELVGDVRGGVHAMTAEEEAEARRIAESLVAPPHSEE